MRRKPIAVLLAVLLALAAGCGRAAGPQPDLVWATGSIAGGASQQIADAWNAAHPGGPRVRVERLPEQADEQHSLLALELNAGVRGYDIVELDLVWTAEFASRGWLVNLAELRPQVEAAALPVAVQSAIWDDHLWAAPFTTDVGLLYYRKDLVAAPPRTWDELAAVGAAVGAQHTIAPFVSDGSPGEGLVVQFLERLRAAGGDLVIDGTEVRLDRAAAIAALTGLRDGYRTGLLAPGWETMQLEDARAAFQGGQAVFLRSWPYAYRAMLQQDTTGQLRDKIGIAALPTGSSGIPAPGLGGHNLAVNRASRHPEQAAEFIRFATTNRDVQRRLATEHSLAPALRVTYRQVTDDPVLTLVGQLLPTAQNRPATPYWAEISGQLRQQILAATVGDISPEAAVDGMQQGIRAAVAR